MRLTLPAAGSPRVFADFKHERRNLTLARTLTVPGPSRQVALAVPASSATTSGGYTVRVDAGSPRAGRYRLYLQFQHERRVRTAAFTARVAR